MARLSRRQATTTRSHARSRLLMLLYSSSLLLGGAPRELFPLHRNVIGLNLGNCSFVALYSKVAERAEHG